jgi:hypothetical protein
MYHHHRLLYVLIAIGVLIPGRQQAVTSGDRLILVSLTPKMLKSCKIILINFIASVMELRKLKD